MAGMDKWRLNAWKTTVDAGTALAVAADCSTDENRWRVQARLLAINE